MIDLDELEVLKLLVQRRIFEDAVLASADELIAMARRYQALKDSGAYTPGRTASCPWGLRMSGPKATDEELDAAIDAAMQEKPNG